MNISDHEKRAARLRQSTGRGFWESRIAKDPSWIKWLRNGDLARYKQDKKTYKSGKILLGLDMQLLNSLTTYKGMYEVSSQ